MSDFLMSKHALCSRLVLPLTSALVISAAMALKRLSYYCALIALTACRPTIGPLSNRVEKSSSAWPPSRPKGQTDSPSCADKADLTHLY